MSHLLGDRYVSEKLSFLVTAQLLSWERLPFFLIFTFPDFEHQDFLIPVQFKQIVGFYLLFSGEMTHGVGCAKTDYMYSHWNWLIWVTNIDWHAKYIGVLSKGLDY